MEGKEKPFKARDDRFYEQIVSAANVVIVRFDSNFRITDFSGSSEKVFGFRKNEVIGKYLMETIVPEQESTGRNLKELMVDIVRNAREHKYNINENVTKNGERIWMQWYNSELKSESDNEYEILSIGIDISDKVEAEKKLKESEERFRMLSELTFEGILIHKNGIILDCNLSLEKQIGYSRTELIGKNLFELLVPEKYHTIIRNMITEKEASYEAEAIHKNGSVIPIMIEAANTLYKQEDVRVVAVRNISEQKKINKALFQSEQRYRELINHISAAVLVHAPDKRIVLCNDIATEMLALSKDQIVGRTLPNLGIVLLNENGNILVADDYPAYRVISDLRPLKGMIVGINNHKNENVDWMLVNAFPFFNTANELIEVIVTYVDITDLKNAQAALRSQALELSTLNKVGREVNSSLTMNQVTKASLKGIMNAIKPDLAMIYLNMGSQLMLNDYTFKAKGKIEVPQLIPEEHFFDSKESGYNTIFIQDMVDEKGEGWNLLRKTGMTSFALLPLKQGENLLGIIGIASEKKRSYRDQQVFLETVCNETAIGIQNAMLFEQVKSHADELEMQVKDRTRELSESVERLQELDKLKSIFLASMSHELRTPLNSIIGYTGIMLMGMTGKLSDEQHQQLSRVKNNAKHLLSLINDILDISKVEAGHVELNIEDINLSRLVKETVDTVHIKAAEKGIEIHTDIPGDLVIRTDLRRITQVILNLLSNAVNYTDKGGIWVKATLLNKNKFRLSVIDTGAGIPESEISRLFQPFQQIDLSLTKKNKGTGLGLYLCRKLLSLLDGAVFVKSKPGKGSEFYFEMPVKI
ncbi:MAG: PAS domain S-box protein [Bacteroidales bacterium]|nr:PAS domain S-box protein [Bacteroidales bacterium]